MGDSNKIQPHSLAAWLAFIRPKTFGIAIAPVIAALSLVFFESNKINFVTAFFTLTIALIMQIISNMKNDLGYTERKAEKSNRRGLPRATASGWISLPMAKAAIAWMIVLGLLNTAILVYFGGWGFATIGIASIIAAYAYMGGPKPIAYTPFGELTVLIFFGLTAVCGSYYLQNQTISMNAILLGLALGAVAALVLSVNNWRDREHDLSVHRHTLAVVMTANSFLLLIRVLLIIPFAAVITMTIQNPALWPSLLVLALIPDAVRIPKELTQKKHEELNETMFACVQLELKFSILFSAGAFLAKYL